MDDRRSQRNEYHTQDAPHPNNLETTVTELRFHLGQLGCVADVLPKFRKHLHSSNKFAPHRQQQNEHTESERYDANRPAHVCCPLTTICCCSRNHLSALTPVDDFQRFTVSAS